MRKLLGLLLAAIGLVFGHAAYQNAPTHREDQLAEVTRILTNPGVETSASSNVAAAQQAKTKAVAAPVSAAVSNPVQVATAQQPVPASTWQTSVSAEATRPGTTAAVSSATPGDNNARRELVRSLQAELKRVGCFSGEATGSWNGSSKRALMAFMERVNASLPVEQPDYIQLTLLQGQAGTVCGRECPKGQGQSSEGRCVPSAILARAESDRRATEALLPSNWDAQTRVAAVKPTDNQKPKKTAALAPSSELPWANTPARRAELPGRMSVGGPLPVEAQPGKRDSGSNTQPAPDRLARLNPLTSDADLSAQEIGSNTRNEAESSTAVGSIDNGTGPIISNPASASERPEIRAPQQFAALTSAVPPQRVIVPRVAAAPKARFVVPRGYYARPQRAARPQKAKFYSNYRPQRSVQNLFTHPLGRF